MQAETSTSSVDSPAVDARAISVKLVFKKALLSKLGHSALSALAEDAKAPENERDAPHELKASKKISKQPSASATNVLPTGDSTSSTTASPKVTVSKTPSKAASSKVPPKKTTGQKQQRSNPVLDAASITTDMGRSVVSSTAGIDLADASGDAIPMSRVKRMMKELLGEVKLANESVAAMVCSCQGFIHYLTNQVSSAQSNMFRQLHQNSRLSISVCTIHF
jgi:hypothetical protein